MGGQEQRAQEFGRRLAQRNPRLHGLFVTTLGGAGVALLGLIKSATSFSMPFAEALSYVVLAIGLWSVATGHTFMEEPESIPRWWRTGALLAALIGGVFGFVVRQ